MGAHYETWRYVTLCVIQKGARVVVPVNVVCFSIEQSFGWAFFLSFS